MTMSGKGAPKDVSKTRARGGVTGHNVRYVLGFSLAGVIIAFLVLAVSYGWLGHKPNDAWQDPAAPSTTQDNTTQ
jgi:hypothetical protein